MIEASPLRKLYQQARDFVGVCLFDLYGRTV
jgi:hypothetical protein